MRKCLKINKNVKMERCDFCDDKVVARRFNIDFHYKGNLVIIEDVPVMVCTGYGEKYYDADVWEQLEKIAKSKTNIKKVILVSVK